MQTLREWRARRLLGVKALADLARVSNKTVVQIEAGRLVPRFTTMRKLADALGVEATEVAEFAVAIEQAGKDAA
jgi:DNA-binding XRE family transcriptional regulator